METCSHIDCYLVQRLYPVKPCRIKNSHSSIPQPRLFREFMQHGKLGTYFKLKWTINMLPREAYVVSIRFGFVRTRIDHRR